MLFEGVYMERQLMFSAYCKRLTASGNELTILATRVPAMLAFSIPHLLLHSAVCTSGHVLSCQISSPDLRYLRYSKYLIVYSFNDGADHATRRRRIICTIHRTVGTA